MYAEDRPTLQKILERVEENNRMLHRIQRARRWGMAWSVTKWLVIASLAAGLYYYHQPFIDGLRATWPGLQTFLDNLGNLPNLLPSGSN